jgi:PAS domain S-box-containing protein
VSDVGAQLGRDARLRALARYAILDTPADPAFDELADMARTLTGTSAAGIGFLDEDRVWLKARAGLDEPELPLAAYPGPWLGEGPGAAAGRPAGADDAGEVWVGTAPFTLGRRPFRFFARAPITTGDGYHLGDLLVLDEQPRELGERAAAALAALARQVLARLELRRTLLSYHTVVDGVGHVVFHLDDRDRLVSVTPTWSQLTGFGAVRSPGQALADYVHPDDRAAVAEQLRELRAGSARHTFVWRLLRLFGDVVPVEVIARPLIDEAGARRGLVGVIADISERRARAVMVQHAQKLEALGQLAAGLAHEINTPIQFVSDNTRFLAEGYEAMLKLVLTYRDAMGELPAEGGSGPRAVVAEVESETDVDFLAEEIPPAIRESLDGVARVAELVRAMKTFSEPGHERQQVDLNETLRTVLTVAGGQLRDVAEVTCDLEELPLVTCHAGDVSQVFLNLLVNAADSIRETGRRGRITVTSRVAGERVVVTVSDTGTGIPESIRLRIFEPFFTTKEVGLGTGQGLHLAWTVVQDRLGGTLSVASEVGVGSTFTISVPYRSRQGAEVAAATRSG